MPKKPTTKVVAATSTTKKVVGLTGMMLLASAVIGIVLTLFIAQ